MFVSTIYRRIFFILSSITLLSLIAYFLFYPIFVSKNVVLNYGFHPFNISTQSPELWIFIKKSYVITYIFSSFIVSNYIYSLIFSKKKISSETKKTILTTPCNGLNLFIGFSNNDKIYLPEKSLFQNILITGTIGTGKTSSAMYPFTEQLISYDSFFSNSKIGLLILDVKGNYYKQVYEYAKVYNRLDDLIIIELKGNIKYNPLDKPNLKASVLANRLKTILTLFSKNNTESYWLDKAESVLSECIKLCRLYNNGYVTFLELHKLITIPTYYKEKLVFLRKLFISGKLSKENAFDLLSSIEFFEKEFNTLDSRTSAILKSEITRITGAFVSDLDVLNTFCPLKKDLNFFGFSEVVNKGKIVVLNMNISEYKILSKIIAAYLKLDFQTEVLSRLTNTPSNEIKKVAFISDEFHEYVTDTDADFFAQSREAKCINIVATQSYTSLLNSIKNEYTVKAIIQNLVNKFWFRTDDLFTVEEAQKQIGKEEKIKQSKSISENSKETNFNYLTHTFSSVGSNVSESINSYTQFDYIYDTNFFTQKLETFSCLAFLSSGNQILPPQKITLVPYFKKNNN